MEKNNRQEKNFLNEQQRRCLDSTYFSGIQKAWSGSRCVARRLRCPHFTSGNLGPCPAPAPNPIFWTRHTWRGGGNISSHWVPVLHKGDLDCISWSLAPDRGQNIMDIYAEWISKQKFCEFISFRERQFKNLSKKVPWKVWQWQDWVLGKQQCLPGSSPG